MPISLLIPTTSAVASDEFAVQHHGDHNDSLPAQFTCPGLAGDETGTLQKKNIGGGFTDCYQDGSLIQITATHTSVTSYGPGVYRVNKSSTSAAVGVEVSTSKNP